MKDRFSDDRILIRPFHADDVDALYQAVRESVNEVAPWLSWCHKDYSRDEAAAFLKSLADAPQAEEAYGFAIIDAQTGELLGGVGLNQINRIHKFANLGYWVRTSCAGRGIASAAARLIARYGFQQLGLERLEIVAAVDNRASQRAAEKAGARREGVLRRRLLIHGRYFDAVLYSLLAEDVEE